MLRPLNPERGATLIEMMVAVAIVVVLLGLAAPNFAAWIQSSQIRTAAESVQNGLQLAKAEAVRRNSSVGFYLTSTMDNACALSATGTNWVVSQRTPTGLCASAPSETAAAPDPLIVQVRSGTEGSRNATIAADQASVIFTALGQATLPSGTVNNINISNSTGGACTTTGGGGGPMRCLRVTVSTSGQIRMCDPAVSTTASPPDSRAC